MASHFEAQLARILADRTSGSRAVTQKLVDLLSSAKLPPRVTREELISAARAILKSAPSFALVFDLFHTVVSEVFDGSASDDTSGNEVQMAVQSWAERWHRAIAGAAGSAAGFLNPDWTIATLSNSGAVLEALRHAHAQGKPLNVVGAESYPGGEGITFLKSARAAGCRTLSVPDDAFAEAVRDSDVLLLGADAVFADSFWNKVGSHSAALSAQDLGIPVVIVAETQKWAPYAWSLAIKPVEVAATEAKAVSTTVLFERVSVSFVFKLACEDGLVSPLELPQYIAAKPCVQDLVVFAPNN